MTQHKTELERLARASYEWTWSRDERAIPDGWPKWDFAPQEVRDEWIGQQRAALQALSEPSEGMVAASEDMVRQNNSRWIYAHEVEMDRIFTAMIKHILEEGESE